MPTSTTVVGNPERIRSLEELENYLSRIIEFERERNCRAGIVKIQRRGLRGLYEIISEMEANELMSRMVVGDSPVEWGIKFWSRSYFERLKYRLVEESRDHHSYGSIERT